jgi:hypothetical protein
VKLSDIVARLPPGWTIEQPDPSHRIFSLREHGKTRIAGVSRAGAMDYLERIARPEWATRSDRVNAHRHASMLGHVPVVCGGDYECPRCGASGRVGEPLIEVYDESGSRMLSRAKASTVARIYEGAPFLARIIDLLAADPIGGRRAIKQGDLLVHLGRCPWPELIGGIFSEPCRG